ncbi:AMP-binding protein [Sphingobium cupriresistens]|uniref:3-methylmercaptopropionyl-CoA ligase n=1 Tax=Sphingobium cupriresistens LL01 TaxID=1420583 RepID=A0A0J7XMV0_9SPHN|nr:AMP-binding protein [Sphingobium cupriresistens]KMS53291.1 short-chain-fatty-acid--CoA ligase [Sphingobium cupriresistens LL01]
MDAESFADRSLSQAFALGARTHASSWAAVSSQVRAGTQRLAQLHEQGLRFGEHLRAHGIGPGDIVAVQLPAWIEWMIAAVGIAHAGAVLLPVVSIYGAKELRFILAQSGAKLIVTPDRWRKADYAQTLAEVGRLPALATHVMIGDAAPGTVPWEAMLAPIAVGPAAPRSPDALALLVYTSGTTADPKGVKHSARTILSEIDAVAWSRRDLGAEVAFCPWPPGHVAGALQLMRFLVTGTPVVLMDQWEPGEAAMLVEKYRIVSSSFTPFHLSGLLDAAERDGRDLSSLRSCMVGAAPVPPTLITRCSAQGLKTYRCYGSSEHPTVTTGHPDDIMEKRLTTEGLPMRGTELDFVDDDGQRVPEGMEGELVVRGPELFLGYLDDSLNSAAFLPGGWFRTGDIGRLDQDGFLMITDRKKDVIIRGGENISSREVEDLLFAHPAIAEAAVVAAPDERMGEIVCAYVVPRPGASVDLESVRTHFAQAGIARQKTPERLIVVDDFPRNSTGKILKHELRAQARAQAGKEAA